MAAETTTFYGLAAKHLASGDVAWVADAVKIMLVTSLYTPLQDSDEFRSDVTDEIAATGGYVAGGNAVTGKAANYDSTTNQENLTAANTLFSALTPSDPIRYGVGYHARGGLASADELLFWVDFGEDKDPDGFDFLISWPTTGVGYLLVG